MKRSLPFAAILFAAVLFTVKLQAQSTNTFQNVKVMNSLQLENLQDTSNVDRYLMIDKHGNVKAGERLGNIPGNIGPAPGGDGAFPGNLTPPCNQTNNSSWLSGYNFQFQTPFLFTCPLSTIVGIGTDNPQFKMDVAGSVNAYEYYINGTPFTSLWQSGSGGRIHYNDGNVGIGITNSNFKLQVFENVKNKVGLVVGDTSARSLWVAPHIGVSGFNYLSQEGDIGIFFRNGNFNSGQSGLVIAPHHASHAGIRIASDGKVGIGTGTPAYTLDANGSINASSYYLNGMQAGLWNLNGSHFYYNDNVGIGTSTPTERLHVEATNGKLRVGEAGNYLKMGFDGANNIIEANGSGVLLINYYSNKDVSIGGDLSVCSKIWVHQSTWCDYVFEPGHQRMSFEEREQYYKKNKKLPLLASEAEISDQGLDIGSTLKGFAFNLEEMGLNQIDLYKMVKAQQEEIEKLKKELEMLKKH